MERSILDESTVLVDIAQIGWPDAQYVGVELVGEDQGFGMLDRLVLELSFLVSKDLESCKCPYMDP